MKGHRFIGTHPDELDGGQPIEPGQFIADLDMSLPRSKSFVDDGLMIEAEIPDELPDGHPETLQAATLQPAREESTTAPQDESTEMLGSYSTSEEELA